MFEDFTPKLKNVTKDKAGTEDVKTLQKSSLRGGRGRREIWKATPQWNEAFKKGRIVFPKMSEVVAFNPV